LAKERGKEEKDRFLFEIAVAIFPGLSSCPKVRSGEKTYGKKEGRTGDGTVYIRRFSALRLPFGGRGSLEKEGREAESDAHLLIPVEPPGGERQRREGQGVT